MIVENKGIRKNKFFIPPFDLNASEIVVLNLFGGQHFYETEMFLKDIFTGETTNENVKVHKPMKFVEPIIRRMFLPITVDKYLKKKANPKSNFATKIYETEWITKNTKVNTLAGNSRKLLSLYATLSETKDIIFDLVGQNPKDAKEIYMKVMENVKSGGSAILLDNCSDMKDDCTKYIELQLIK